MRAETRRSLTSLAKSCPLPYGTVRHLRGRSILRKHLLVGPAAVGVRAQEEPS